MEDSVAMALMNLLDQMDDDDATRGGDAAAKERAVDALGEAGYCWVGDQWIREK